MLTEDFVPRNSEQHCGVVERTVRAGLMPLHLALYLPLTLSLGLIVLTKKMNLRYSELPLPPKCDWELLLYICVIPGLIVFGIAAVTISVYAVCCDVLSILLRPFCNVGPSFRFEVLLISECAAELSLLWGRYGGCCYWLMWLLLGVQANGTGLALRIDMKNDAEGPPDDENGSISVEAIESRNFTVAKEMFRLDSGLRPSHYEWSSFSDEYGDNYSTNSWEMGFRVHLQNGNSKFLRNRDEVVGFIQLQGNIQSSVI